MPGDDRAVVGAAAVAVQLDPVVEDPLDVVERVRPVLVARELDRAPDLVLGRVGLAREPLELALEPLLLAARRACRAGAAGSRAGSAAPRSLRSASPGKEPEEPRQVRTLLGSGDDGVDVAEAEVLLGERRSRRAASRVVICWTTRGPVNAISAPGSAIVTSPSDAKLASTPPVVGWASTTNIGSPASCRSSTAQTVFGSCISERIPSCMRAPPELETVQQRRAALDRRVARARRTSRRRRSPSSRP